MRKLRISIAVGALVLAGVACTAGPAFATDAPVSTPTVFVPYSVSQDWYAPLPATAANAFAVPQHIAVLLCGGVKQHDEYTITTALMDTHYKALIATATLNSPAEDAEFSPHSYTVVDLPACAPVVTSTPTPTPTPTVTPTTTPKPVVTVDTKPSTSVAPTLAFTGQTKAEAMAAKKYYETGYIGFGALIAAGIAMVFFGLYGRRKNKREEQNV